MDGLESLNIGYVLVLSYLVLLNGVAFALFGIDKHKARKGSWRIPERTLLLLSVLGGSVGALAGIKVWHHKTLHKKFSMGVPVILCLQVALAVWLYICR